MNLYYLLVLNNGENAIAVDLLRRVSHYVLHPSLAVKDDTPTKSIIIAFVNDPPN